MQPRTPITAVIITLNGERLLGRCLDSLAFCERILIVDSFSTDSTEAIARAHGALFLQNPWPGNARQIQFGVDWLAQNAPTDWVLFLDCDELCSPELAESILAAVADPKDSVAFSMPRRTWYYDRFLRHGGSYPDRLFRLFRPGAMRIEEHGAHQQFVPAGPGAKLEGDLLHYTYASFQNQLEKLNDYAQRGARDLQARGRRGGIAAGLAHGTWRFLDMYFARLGLLDGRAGFLMAAHTAFYTFLKYIRISEGTWGAPYATGFPQAQERMRYSDHSEGEPEAHPSEKHR